MIMIIIIIITIIINPQWETTDPGLSLSMGRHPFGPLTPGRRWQL